MPTKRIQMQWDAQVNGVQDVQRLAALSQQLVNGLKDYDRGARQARSSAEEFTKSVAVQAAEFTAGVAAVTGYAAAIKAATVEATQYAARTQTLEVVTKSLARVNNINVSSTLAVADALKKQGITTQESLSTINRMIFAQLDLAKASQLARVAQDAAIISNVTSAEALNGIVNGIVTRQTDVLKTYGIAVTFETEFARAAQKLGRELTEQEKIQQALNIVLREGAKISGTYEAAMTTVGKQVTSLVRYTQEAKNAVGQEFLPVMQRTVGVLTEVAKQVEQNSAGFATLASGIGSASAAALAFRFTPGPLPFRLGVAGAVAAGSFFATRPEKPEEAVSRIQEQGSEVVGNLLSQRKSLGLQVEGANAIQNREERVRELKRIDDAARTIDRQIKAVQDQLTAELARILVKRGKDLPVSGVLPEGQASALATKTITSPIELGGGVQITRSAVGQAIINQQTPGTIEGPLVNQQLLDQQNRQALADMAAAELKKAKKQVEDFLRSMRDDGLAPLAKLYVDEQNKIEELRKSFPSAGLQVQIGQIKEAFRNRRTEITNDLLFPGSLRSERSRDLIPDLFSTAAFGAPRKGIFSTSTEEINQANAAQQAVASYNRTGDIRDNQNLQRQKTLELMRTELSYQERLVQLSAGAGGQVAAINAISRLRVEAAKQEFSITQDEARLREQMLSAEQERTLSLLQLRRQELDNFKNSAGQLFDALRSKGAVGAGDFIRGQFDNILKTAFVNTSGLFFEQFRKANLQLPGTGTAANPTILGKILQGTPFGADPLKDATAKQVDALDLNRASIDRLTAVMGGGVPGQIGAGGGKVSGTIGALGGILGGIPGGVFQGGTGPVFTAVQTGGGLLNRILGSSTTIPTPGVSAAADSVIAAQQAASLAQAGINSGRVSTQRVAQAGQIAAGGLLAYSGFKQGGASGTLQGISGVLGAAAAIPGPQQPFLLAGSMIAGFISSILPDPKKVREQTIDRALAAAQTSLPTGKTLEVDMFGRQYDYNNRGEIRIINNFAFSAIDSQSLMDRRYDLADVVKSAAADGHPVVDEFRAQIQG